MTWFKNRPVFTLFFLGALIFLLHLGVLPVTIMEARNFITAREMMVDGNWLLTTMNGLPRYEKPPLPSWITAVFGGLFGMDKVAALRFPTMFMAILLAYTGYRFSYRMLGERTVALLNGLILLSSFYIIAITNEAPWDIYTHGFMLLAIYFLYLFFQERPHRWRNSILAGCFIGLSFMSKGPISFYGLLLPFLISYILVFRPKGFRADQKIAPLGAMILTALAVGLWWFLYVRFADPETFLAITQKETSNWSSYNVRPFYYYWSFFTQSGLWTLPALVGLFYPYLKNRVAHPQIYRLTFFWTLFSLILLSVVPEKKARYLVPVLIPLALNTGIYLQYVLTHFQTRFSVREKLPVWIHFGLIGILAIALPIALYVILGDTLGGLWPYYVLFSLASLTVGVFLLLNLKKERLFSCLLLSVFFVALIKSLAFPLINALPKNKAYTDLSQLRAEMMAENIPVYCFGEIAPELIWDYGASLTVLKSEAEITVPNDNTFAILVISYEENEFKRIFGLKHTYTLKTTFDLNPNADPGSSGHKNRLTSNLYIVQKQ